MDGQCQDVPSNQLFCYFVSVQAVTDMDISGHQMILFGSLIENL